ncbi:S49 family peptidase, partial [Desulfobulbus sp. F3]|nr:S49 family peptidase [Desulfobulbus sp. F3]
MERIAAFFRWIWRLTAAVSILFTLFFFLALSALLSGAASWHRQSKPAAVPESCVLVLAPGGSILEQRPPYNPAEELSGLLNRSPQRKELFLQDIISGLRTAAKDSRIKLLLIVPDQIERAGLNQLRDIGQAVAQFRAAGKRVIAAADTYSQGQYYLAAGSDEIYLNPMGSVDIQGFGLFNLYFRELLDKLEVTFHIFRVGEFKAAVEPLLRNDMSPEAKENSLRWLGRLWAGYGRDIAALRHIPPQRVNEAAENLAEQMEAAGGDAAVMAQRSKLIDGMKTSAELREHLRRLVGGSDDEDGYSRIDFSDYLDAVGGSYSKKLAGKDQSPIWPSPPSP